MNILVRGKQMQVTEALKDYAQKRIGKLSKYSDEFSDVHVVLSTEREQQKVEVTAPLGGFILRGEEATEDMYTSIDSVVEKLERQISKYRKRLNRKRGKAEWEQAQLEQDIAAGLAPLGDEEAETVVRTKKFQARPMSVEEAIMQMNLLSHSFFVFLDVDAGRISVVYKRQDGSYGLLEPEY